MEQALTHELLNKLKEDGFTVLFAPGQHHQQSYVFIPIGVDVDEFQRLTALPDYQQDAFFTMEEALLMEESELFKHKVITS
ncbi:MULTISPECIES: hypothetical protein [Sphingobacteriaceae]|uniref:Uncharacterized protein n=1 Tax=Sphingobacterium sp. (strain 21) TaxID=743722 RepID=F4C6A0_SPHS2